MKELLLITILLVFARSQYATAQYSLGYDSLLQEKFNYQVKQISQFFDRFNFTEPLKLSDDNVVSRKKNLVSLINIKDDDLIRNPETIEFLKFVGNELNHIYLNYEDSSWFSTAHCSFIYHNDIVAVDIILKMQGQVNRGYKWVIMGVKSDIFLPPNKNDPPNSAFINPMNHEIGFSELSKAIREKSNIFYYANSSYKPDVLTAFFYMLRNGDIILKQIDKVDYQFFQIPGWMFEVKDFNRAELNSGWLIANIKRMDEKDKYFYKMSLLNY